MTKWEKIKFFVNSNEIFTRKDVNNELKIHTHSYDQYLLLLAHANFIEKTQRGEYKRLRLIPDDVTTNLINKLAYNIEIRTRYFRKLKLEKINNSL